MQGQELSGPTSEADFLIDISCQTRLTDSISKRLWRATLVDYAFLRSAITKPTRLTFHACTALNQTLGSFQQKPGVGVSVEPPGGHQMYGLSCRLSLWWQLVGAPWPALVRPAGSCQCCCWVRKNAVAHACRIQCEESLSMPSLHAIGGGPPVLMWQFNPKFHPDIFYFIDIPDPYRSRLRSVLENQK